ncbi:MAG: archaemetzincin family Zn-dependent metalloprotease [Ignavibacteriales bacterium]|nr:archaemetzincin family Zn-dependent metalloprotease [Ignavibacteriales bacterium]
MTSIILVPLLPVSEELVHTLVTPLSDMFRTSITVESPIRGIVDNVYDYSRAQYNSTLLIKELLQRFDGQSKVLGITSVDLFVPVLTYVFGEAQLDGVAGVMSTYRLDDTIYGLPADNAKFFERTIKESVHELGHTFGLLHCKNFDCSMHSSTTVDDIDIKGAMLCGECLRKITAK